MVASRQVKGGYLLRYKMYPLQCPEGVEHRYFPLKSLRLSCAAPGFACICDPLTMPAVEYTRADPERFFGPNAWCEQWVVLHEDSTLCWFKEKGKSRPEGYLHVRDAPDLLAVSQWTLRIPGRPHLPHGCGVLQLLAVGQGKVKNKKNKNNSTQVRKIHWLLARDQQECHSWMTAISHTLPPLPPPPPPPLPPRNGASGSKTFAVHYSAPGSGDPNDGVVDLPAGLLAGSGVQGWQNMHVQAQAQAQAIQSHALSWGGWGLGGGFPSTSCSSAHGGNAAGPSTSAPAAAAAGPIQMPPDHGVAFVAPDCSAAAAAASSAVDSIHVDFDLGDVDLVSSMDCIGDFSF